MATYYVDATLGSDSNDGDAAAGAAPIQSTAEVNRGFAGTRTLSKPNFANGDTISFKSGEVWDYDTNTFAADYTNGQYYPSILSITKNVTMNAYDSGARPLFNASWDIVGKTWVDQGSNIWMATYGPNNPAGSTAYIGNALSSGRINRVRFKRDGVTTDYPWATSSSVSETNRFYNTEDDMYVWASGNPDGYYSNIYMASSYYGFRVDNTAVTSLTLTGLEVRGADLLVGTNGASSEITFNVDDCVLDQQGWKGLVIHNPNTCQITDNTVSGDFNATVTTPDALLMYDGITLTSAGTYGNTITGNTISDVGHTAIEWQSFVDTNDSVYNNILTGANSPYLRGLGIKGNYTNIFKNYIFDMSARNQIQGNSNLLYNNIFDKLHLETVYWGDYQQVQHLNMEGSASSNLVYNNTFSRYDLPDLATPITNQRDEGTKAIEFNGLNCGTSGNNIVRNNVFIQNEVSGTYAHYAVYIQNSAPPSRIVFEDNYFDTQYSNTDDIIIDDVTPADNTVAGADSQYGTWSNNNSGSLAGWPSSYTDSSSDFALVSGLALIDNGQDLSGSLTDDYIGTERPQNGVFDIGAYEFLTGEPPTPITGDQMINLPIQAAKLPTSNPARIDGGQDRWYLLFDATTNQTAQWQFRMPDNYSSGLTAKIIYTMASATSGTCVFKVYTMSMTGSVDTADLDTDDFGSANVGTTNPVPSTQGYPELLSITLSNFGGPNNDVAAGDIVIIKLERSASTDTAANDAEVAALALEYIAA